MVMLLPSVFLVVVLPAGEHSPMTAKDKFPSAWSSGRIKQDSGQKRNSKQSIDSVSFLTSKRGGEMKSVKFTDNFHSMRRVQPA
jgi:hypothetical protein